MSIEEIWTTFHQKLRAYIIHRVASQEDAEDILQSIFEKIFKNQNQIAFIENIAAWLYKITKNEIISYYRKQKAYAELSEDLLAVNDTAVFVGDQFLANCLQVFIKDLSSEEQYILQQTILGRKLVKIAEDLRKKYSTVKSKYQRACEKLRKRFLVCCQINTISTTALTIRTVVPCASCETSTV